MDDTAALGLPDWDRVKLVAFDVDGTLYDQWPLRFRMARALVFHTVRERTLRVITVLRRYRRIREELGDAETRDFEPVLIDRTAWEAGCSPETVRALVSEWIERRPLPFLRSYRCAGVLELFAALRRRGKIIGVLSDYPAAAKLEALGLSADHVVSADQEGVQALKPHPRGLERLMAAAHVKAEATVVIGDRAERDGLVARRVGALPLIRSSRPIEGWRTFDRYDGPLFAPLLVS